MAARARTGLVCVAVFALLRVADSPLAARLVPAGSVSLSRTPATSSVGSPIVFEASVAPPEATDPLEYSFWVWTDTRDWINAQPYGANHQFVLTPDVAGSYTVQVWVRRAGHDVPYDTWASSGYFTVDAAQQVQLESFTPNVPFPAAAGAPIIWSATSNAPPADVEYEFWVMSPAGWSVGQPYGASSSFTWTPAAPGAYVLQVWLRRRGSQVAYHDWRSSGLLTVGPPSVTAVSIVADRRLPLSVGEPLRLTATASGSVDAEFQFWRLSNGVWTLARDYAADPRYTWLPGGNDSGVHVVQVWARRRGSLLPFEAWASTGGFEVLSYGAAMPSLPGPCYQPVPSYIARDYLSDLVVSSRAELASRRAALTSWIWGPTGSLTDAHPVVGSHQVGIVHPQIAALDLPNLARVDRYRVDVPIPALPEETEAPLVSHIYEFVPAVANGRLLIYMQGHLQDPESLFDSPAMIGADGVLRMFLERGYRVVFMQMPLLGDNQDPRFPFEGTKNHDVLGSREREGFNPLRPFLEPVAAVINYAFARFGPMDVSMTGVSGGGWLTTVYAAIDTRITNSFPVAGSMPYSLNQGADDPCAHGMDWEQAQFSGGPESPQPLGYLDLYVLGSTADADSTVKRQQIQILNRYDPCCWTGAKAENTYAEELGAFITSLGGSYSMTIDATHLQHLISTWALREVVLPALGHDKK